MQHKDDWRGLVGGLVGLVGCVVGAAIFFTAAFNLNANLGWMCVGIVLLYIGRNWIEEAL